MSDERLLNRRRFLLGAGGVTLAGIAAAGAALDARASAQAGVRMVALGQQPAGLPVSQHAWEQTMARDQFGNAIGPSYDRLIMFDVRGRPTPAYARLLESTLRRLERTYAWGPAGLLFTVGWSHAYFKQVLGVSSPVPQAKALSDFELPTIDDYHLCIHLACDDPVRLEAAERLLVASLAPALRRRETRTGFAGAGLPAAHQHVGGIPAGDPVPRDSPLFMGFKSALKKNQATEQAVTIPDGQFAQGTTMTVSYMHLRLQSWYQDLSYAQRVARMYSPQTTPADVSRFTTDARSNPGQINQAISHYGVVGHSQASARARVNGRPIILRRDFDTVDGGLAGLHFVSLQRTIEDFIKTRTAMNQSGAQLINPAVTETVNNGINEFIFVLRRANYILPSRAQRSFPLLPGRAAVL